MLLYVTVVWFRLGIAVASVADLKNKRQVVIRASVVFYKANNESD